MPYTGRHGPYKNPRFTKRRSFTKKTSTSQSHPPMATVSPIKLYSKMDDISLYFFILIVLHKIRKIYSCKSINISKKRTFVLYRFRDICHYSYKAGSEKHVSMRLI